MEHKLSAVLLGLLSSQALGANEDGILTEFAVRDCCAALVRARRGLVQMSMTSCLLLERLLVLIHVVDLKRKHDINPVHVPSQEFLKRRGALNQNNAWGLQ